MILFPWADYQAALAYLRDGLRPGTRVANVLRGVAVNGPSGRLPAFPAESLTWLFVVRPDDEEKFIATLRHARFGRGLGAELKGDASATSRFPRLVRVIRELYEPETRFGEIAVWRRRVVSGTVSTAPTRLTESPVEHP